MLYDKKKAAKDQRAPHWFDVWKVDKDDVGRQVWRLECRAGREALKRYIKAPHRRSYENVDAILAMFLNEIRYVLELMRKERYDMVVAQAFGNFNNAMTLEGLSPDQIKAQYALLSEDRTRRYVDGLGPNLLNKSYRIRRRGWGFFEG